MPNWIDVETYLTNKIIPLLKSRRVGKEWLRKLPIDNFGMLLGINMAIDIASGAIPPEVFVNIIDSIKSPFFNARLAFFKAQNNHPKKDEFVCASKINTPILTNNTYLRVLEIEDFADYYVRPSFSFLPYDPPDIKEIRRRYFKKRTSLANIDNWYNGSYNRVWVMSKAEFNSICSSYPKHDHGSIFNDALGIGYKYGGGLKGKPEMVAIEYPKNFSLVCKQPTLLDSQWKIEPIWYISENNKDGWGRTQSCSGTYDGIKERVHSSFKNLSRKYFAVYIGLSKTPMMNENALMNEAYYRFEIATK